MYKEVPVLCKQQSPHFYEINAATANARVHALEEFHYLWFLKKGNQVVPNRVYFSFTRTTLRFVSGFYSFICLPLLCKFCFKSKKRLKVQYVWIRKVNYWIVCFLLFWKWLELFYGLYGLIDFCLARKESNVP